MKRKSICFVLMLMLVFTFALPVSASGQTFEGAAAVGTQSMTSELEAEIPEWYFVSVPTSICCEPLIEQSEMTFEYSIKGDIAGNRTINITPIPEYTSIVGGDGVSYEGCFVDLVEVGGTKANVPVRVKLPADTFGYGDLAGDGYHGEGTLKRWSKLSAGNWSAQLNWNITMQ